MIKLGDKDRTPMRCLKVMKGDSLVWEKTKPKTISWTTSSQVSPYGRSIDIPISYQLELKGKQLLFMKIGELGEISKEYIKIVFPTDDRFKPYISFSKSFNELLGITDLIPAGTKITVTYK